MKRFISTLALVSLVFCAGAQAATASSKKPVRATRIGVLACQVDGGVGLVFGSSKGINCAFKHTDGTTENYVGRLGKLGVDIGVTRKSYLNWAVVTPAGNKPGASALAGDYVGVSAGASLGLGLGANALVGGSNKSIGLQPFSTEGTQGLNVAVGVSKLTLQPVEVKRVPKKRRNHKS